MHLNASERRGALLVLAIFALGAARDLWETRAHTPPRPGATPGVPIPLADPVLPPADAEPSVAAEAPGPGDGGAPAVGRPPQLDLNRASPIELETLPGVGPVLAGRIVNYRREHGPFRVPEELLAIRGVGPKSFARLRIWVRVDPTREGDPTPAANGTRDPRVLQPGR